MAFQEITRDYFKNYINNTNIFYYIDTISILKRKIAIELYLKRAVDPESDY